MFIDRGRIVLECSMEEFESRYVEVMVNPEHVVAARALKPIHERPVFGRSVLLFDGANREEVAALGEARRPSIADLFVDRKHTSELQSLTNLVCRLLLEKKKKHKHT